MFVGEEEDDDDDGEDEGEKRERDLYFKWAIFLISLKIIIQQSFSFHIEKLFIVWFMRVTNKQKMTEVLCSLVLHLKKLKVTIVEGFFLRASWQKNLKTKFERGVSVKPFHWWMHCGWDSNVIVALEQMGVMSAAEEKGATFCKKKIEGSRYYVSSDPSKVFLIPPKNNSNFSFIHLVTFQSTVAVFFHQKCKNGGNRWATLSLAPQKLIKKKLCYFASSTFTAKVHHAFSDAFCDRNRG